jgi:hypothetical protein
LSQSLLANGPYLLLDSRNQTNCLINLNTRRVHACCEVERQRRGTLSILALTRGQMSARHITLVLSISFSSLINLPTYPPPSATSHRFQQSREKTASCQLYHLRGVCATRILYVDGSFEDSAIRILSTITSSICSLEQAQRSAKIIPLVLQCLSESHDDFASICGRHTFSFVRTL